MTSQPGTPSSSTPKMPDYTPCAICGGAPHRPTSEIPENGGIGHSYVPKPPADTFGCPWASSRRWRGGWLSVVACRKGEGPLHKRPPIALFRDDEDRMRAVVGAAIFDGFPSELICMLSKKDIEPLIAIARERRNRILGSHS